MKKYIVSIAVLGVLSFGVLSVKASTIDDVMAQIKVLQQQVFALQAQASAFALDSIKPATISAPAKTTVPAVTPKAITPVSPQTVMDTLSKFNANISVTNLPISSFVKSTIVDEPIPTTKSPLTSGPSCNNYVFSKKIGSYGSSGNQFANPEGVSLDSVGNIYIADYGNNRISRFDSTGNFVYTFGWGVSSGANQFEVCSVNCHAGIGGTGNGQFHLPEGVSVDSVGNIYVADTQNHRIQKFTSNGTYITQWGTYGISNGQFKYPVDTAIDFAGNVYVADIMSSRIQKFTSNGTYIAQWGTQGTGNGQFETPSAITIDSSDNVYVTDTGYPRVQKFTSNGTYITQWGSQGTGNGQFEFPVGIAVDSLNNIYVTNSSNASNHRIQKFTSNGVYITQLGQAGTGNGQLNYPQGIDVDLAGNIYVADVGNNRIVKFQPLCVTCTAGVSRVGDANNSGTINAADSLLISQIFSGIIPTPSNICCVDVNGDGAVNATDSLFVMHYFVGQTPSGLAGQICPVTP